MKSGLILIVVGAVIFNFSHDFIVYDSRLVGTSIGLILALVGVSTYTADKIADHLRRRGY